MDARKRIERLEGRHSLVDGIPFALPVALTSITPQSLACRQLALGP